jgi:mevalonate kinase
LVKKAIDKTYSFLQKKPDKGFVIKINSQIPIGQGLGSSAALATSLTAAILLLEEKKLDKEKINKISHETETAQHGNASGSDTTISCYGGFLIFQKKDDKLTFKSLKTASFFQKLMLLNSGQPKESTAQMVGLADKQKNKKVFADIGKITKEIIKTLKQKDVFKLKKLIIKNQKLLEDLGVVGSKAKKIIKLIEKQGGAGKICGAGGIKKGSGMILAFHPQPKNLKKTLNKKNIKHLNIKINQPGVRQEK